VTAVLVAHNGEQFLPRTLSAIASQVRAPDLLVGVDTGSDDGSATLVAGASSHLLRLPKRTAMGDAVQAALAALDAGKLSPAPDPRPEGAAGQRAEPGEPAVRDWVWLLHDDAAPAPDALRRLLDAVDVAPSAVIAGCKQVGWDDGRLLDVGFTTSPLGKKVTGVDVDDVDQGQLDHRSDVLAVSTAGMLVRRDVWDALGGPDPTLVRSRDDLDLCRRAHLAGYRVIVVPQAVVAHAEAGASGRRPFSTPRAWARADRRDAIHLRLAATAWLAMPFVVAWTLGAAVLRAVGRLALKQPGRACDELAAVALALLRPGPWLRARRRTRGSRRVSWRAVRRLNAPPRQIVRARRDAMAAHLREQDAAWLAGELARLGVDPEEASATADGEQSADGSVPVLRSPVETGPVAEEAESAPTWAGARRISAAGRGWLPLAGVVAATAVAALVGLRSLVGGHGAVTSSTLLPAPADAGALWRAATSGWRPVGLGGAAAGDPLGLVLAVLAAPFGGSARTAVLWLLLFAVPLSAITAWVAAGAIARSRALRAWAALVWAAAPCLLVAVGGARLGAVLAHILLPLVALGLARTVGIGGTGRGSLAAASGTGLALTAVLASAPALAGPVVLAVVVVAVIAPTGRRLLWWTLLLPAVLLAPWWVAVAQQPALLLAEPGAPTGGAGPAPAAGWSLLLMPVDPAAVLGRHGLVLGPAVDWLARVTGVPAAATARALVLAAAIPLLAIALAGSLRVRRFGDRRGTVAVAALIAALAGLAVAVLAPRIALARAAGAPVRTWGGAGLSLAELGVLTAALCGLTGAAGRLRRRPLGPRHVVVLCLGALLVLAPAGYALLWAWQGWDGGHRVVRAGPDVLPAVTTVEAEGPAATRTLVVREGPSGLRWNLLRAAGPRLGDSSAALAYRAGVGTGGPADQAEVLPVLGAMLSDSGSDVRAQLEDLDVGSVLLLPPLGESSVNALDASPGLVRVGTPEGAVLWRVELSHAGADTSSRPARVRVLAADGETLQPLPSSGANRTEVDTRLQPGPAGRALVLAERADEGWRAWLDGRELVPARHGGWAQSFLLPAAGGHLVVEHRGPAQRAVDLTRTAVLGLALLLALPLPRRRRRLLAAHLPPSSPPTSGRGRR
jgi:GT2 family glycosyltransferase